MSKVSLTRRRGARRSHGSHATILIGLVALLVVIAMMLGLLLGTHWSQDTPAVAKLRGAAEAGVHKLLERSKAIRDLDSLVKSYSKEHKEKHDHDDELKEHDLQKHVQKKNQRGTDDDKIPAEGKELKSRRQKSSEDEDGDEEEVEDNGGDLSPSARPKPVMDTSVGKLGPYPYSLDPVPSHIDFNSWKAPGGKRFSEYTQGDSPYTITQETREKSDIQARSRRQHILNAMKFAWAGYSRFAFGHDEVLPQSHGISDNWGRIGTTLVDSLDTLWLFGMKEEFWKARDWVRDSLRCESAGTVSVFETTIRSLGGLLSAYDWSHDEAFLEKAKDLGSRLFHAFDGHEIPNGQVNLNNGQSFNVGWAGNNVILSEAGTIQLEFRYLAKMTNITEYAKKSERVFEILDSVSPPSGLLPYFIRNMNNPPSFSNNKLTFGAMADSYYEYMLKVWLQGGKKEPLYRKMYDRSMDGMHSELLQSSTPSGLVYIADKNGGNLDHKMDHLVCFMGGLLALGAYTDPLGLQSPRAQRDLTTAKALTYTCYQMYARMNTGISAEFVQFYEGRDFVIGAGAPHYLLRPEAFESFFVLHHLTGDPIYREWGWECFLAIERYCKTDIAYGSLHDVSNVDGRAENKMESFFLAETLKYLFLLQDPDSEIDLLNKHVFNTEAHPLRIFPLIDLAAKE